MQSFQKAEEESTVSKFHRVSQYGRVPRGWGRGECRWVGAGGGGGALDVLLRFNLSSAINTHEPNFKALASSSGKIRGVLNRHRLRGSYRDPAPKVTGGAGRMTQSREGRWECETPAEARGERGLNWARKGRRARPIARRPALILLAAAFPRHAVSRMTLRFRPLPQRVGRGLERIANPASSRLPISAAGRLAGGQRALRHTPWFNSSAGPGLSRGMEWPLPSRGLRAEEAA